MANIYSPIGRKGYYSFETVELGGTRYTWKPNQDRWEISGGSAFEDITGGRVPGINDRERLPSGEFAGGTYNNTTKGSTIPISDNGTIVQFQDYVFIVKSNVNSNLLVNGSPAGKSPQTLRFPKADILTGGDKRITVQQDGYTSNVEYIISSEVVAGNLNANPYEKGYSTGIFGGNQITLGMATSTVTVKKYVNGQIVSYNGQNGNLFNLDFDLKRVIKRGDDIRIPDRPIDIALPIDTTEVFDKTLTIIVSGNAEGLILRKNNRDLVELSSGQNKIEDVTNAKYVLTVDSGYKITKFATTLDGAFTDFKNGGSPNLAITLDRDVNIKLEVRRNVVPTPVPTPPPPPGPEIFPLPPQITEQEREERRTISTPIIPDGPDPLITLLDNASRTYDVKDKSGLPIAFRKNEEVRAVTAFVGTKHYVFDNLGNKPIAGIVIPASAFQQLGRLEVKIIPYDLDELDDTLEQITRTAITRTKEITEERIIEVRRPVPTPIEVEERYENPPPRVIVEPPLETLPPKPKPKLPIIVPTRPPKLEQPKPRIVPTPQPVRVVPSPPSRGGGSVGGENPNDFLDRTTGGRKIPSPYDAGGGFDNSDGTRTRRTERLL